MQATGLCLLRRDLDAPGRAVLYDSSPNLLSSSVGEAEWISSKESDDQAIAK